MLDLHLGTKATLRFHNAHEEGQAIEMLKSAFPGLLRGTVKAMYWENGVPKQDYSTPQIELIEK